MGLLVDGKWQDRWYDTDGNDGEFKRQEQAFRHWITKDGSAGPSGEGGFKAEVGRYHLYVSLACPWAHRTLIFRELKGLQEVIGVSIVEPKMLENGWEFPASERGETPASSPEAGLDYLYQLYTRVDPEFTGRVTVPVLWDKHQKTIVNNESAEIIRMLNSAFDDVGATPGDYYPNELRDDIDAINEQIYETVNNGVYRAGFATKQSAYQRAYTALFDTLAELEQRLGRQRYLCGKQVTEADWRLFTTLVRFDAVYHGHFKCNYRQIRDYPQLSGYLRDLYQHPGIAGTVNFEHIKTHYYFSHTTINPTQVVPAGPALELDKPHKREVLGL